MAARTSQEEQKIHRRRRLLQGLLIGGAAVGVPALANAMIARRSRKLAAPVWGRPHQYAWEDGEIAFQRLGKGSPLVLLHSFGPGHDAEEWRFCSEALAKDHTIFAPDLIGWGRSAKPNLEYDGETYIRLISSFLEDVVQERCVLIAAGLPAAYAVQVAVDEPQLVRGLALVTPSGLDTNCDEPDIKDALVYRLLKLPILGTSALNLFTSRAAIQHYLRRDLFGTPDRADAGTLDHHYRSSHQPGSHLALAAFLSGYSNHRLDEQLSRLGVPVWLGWGRKAKLPPVESADLWLQRLSGAELEVFDGTGNLPHEERPGRFSRRLAAFLAGMKD